MAARRRGKYPDGTVVTHAPGRPIEVRRPAARHRRPELADLFSAAGRAEQSRRGGVPAAAARIAVPVAAPAALRPITGQGIPARIAMPVTKPTRRRTSSAKATATAKKGGHRGTRRSSR